MRVAFVVQGEGRGHMTQALALASALDAAGHRVEPVLVGRSPWRGLPPYVREGFGREVLEFDAPTLVPDADGRGLSVLRTGFDILTRAPRFARSVRTIREATLDADVVVNFLDLLAGLARTLDPGPPTVAVAHNHLFLHPQLRDAPGPAPLRRVVLGYAGLTALGAGVRIGLSFRRLTEDPAGRVCVAPPLLRPGLAELPASDGGYLLAYALNPGNAQALASWQRRRPKVEVHCYVEGGGAAVSDAGPGFHAHELAADPFLRHLAGCRAYAGSAGFESLCEAHWLGKPVLAVPTPGHFEQVLNAWDAERCGVARAGGWMDLDTFWEDAVPPDPRSVADFRAWTAQAPDILVDAVERTARTTV